MNSKRNSIILILAIFFLSAYFLLIKIGVIGFNKDIVLSAGFMLYGLILTFLNIGNGEKYKIFIGTFFFLTGVALYSSAAFSLINIKSSLFQLMLIIFGSGFLMLYYDSAKRDFLIYSMTLILAGLIGVFFGANFFFFKITSLALEYIVNNWLIFIIIYLCVSLILSIRKERF